MPAPYAAGLIQQRGKPSAPRYNGLFRAKIFLFLRWLLPKRVIGWIVRLKD